VRDNLAKKATDRRETWLDETKNNSGFADSKFDLQIMETFFAHP